VSWPGRPNGVAGPSFDTRFDTELSGARAEAVSHLTRSFGVQVETAIARAAGRGSHDGGDPPAGHRARSTGRVPAGSQERPPDAARVSSEPEAEPLSSIVSSNDGHVYALDAMTLRELWRYPATGRATLRVSPPSTAAVPS